MITHYNAFISYRHTQRDIEVASEVQKQLEHFRIPEAIQKSSGIKKIERIFRDKDELPLSSNLGNDIETALDMSDYLIVICSPHTAESAWVQREIDLFLETHDQNRILTVISEGEPEDVLPERLTYRTETYTDENGKEQVRKIPLEPLSCDYRMPFKKARKQELPRLAAVILGCSYDELVQRARQYRQRRLLAASAVTGALSLAAIAWLVWSNIRISENLKQAQINESQYLSFGSAEALNDQDRILAIQLALEALPKEGNERPVIAAAEKALADAVGAYLPSGRYTKYFASDKYSAESVIRDFWLDSSKSTLITLDMDSRLTWFDLVNDQTAASAVLPGNITVLQNSDKDILAFHDDSLVLYSQKNGDILFDITLPERTTRAECYSGGCIFQTASGLYDVDNKGNIVNMYPDPDSYAYQMKVSDDGHRILRSISNGDDSYSVVLLDNGSRSVLPERFMYPVDLQFTDSGNIIVADYDVSRETIGTGTFEIYSPMRWNVSCRSEDGSEVLWSHEFSHSLSSASDFYLSSYTDDAGTHQCLIASTGFLQTYINTETGEIIRQAEYPSSVIRVLSDNNNAYLSLLYDGSIAILSLDQEDYSTLPAFSAKTADGMVYSNDSQAGALIRTSGGNSVIRYDLELDNPNYTEFADLDDYTIRSLKVSDSHIAVTATKLGTIDPAIYIYDRNDSTHRVDFSYPEGNDTGNLFGVASDGETAWSVATGYNSAVLRRMNLKDGEQEDIELCSGLNLSSLTAYAGSDTVWCLAVSYADHMVYCSTYDIAGKKETVVSLPSEDNLSFSRITVSKDGQKCLAETDDHTLCLIGLNDLSMITLNEEDAPEYYKPVFGNQKVAFRTASSVRIMDFSGKTLLDLPQDMMNVLSFSFLNDQLAVLTNNGLLNIYDAQGNITKTYSVPVPAGKAFYYFDRFSWELYDNTLALSYNNTIYIIDLNQDSPRITVNSGWKYDHERQQIIVQSYYGDGVGIFHVCSPQELIEQGKAVIKDTEIPEEIRKKYGLND